MIRRQVLILGGCAALLLLPSCAAGRAAAARKNALEQGLDAYVIPRPLAEVWPKATLSDDDQGAFAGNGAQITWNDTGPFRMKTAPRTETRMLKGTVITDVSWYECEGKSVPGGSQVHYREVIQRTSMRVNLNLGTQDVGRRRTDLELDLLSRVDPAAAKRIEAQGAAAARANE